MFIIYMLAYPVKHIFTTCETMKEVDKILAENEYHFVDENGFDWNLDYGEEN